MGRPCTVCESKQRPAVDEALVTGQLSLNAIGRKYRLGPDSLSHHRRVHISPALARVVAAKAEEAVLSGAVESVLARAESLASRIEMMLTTVEAAGQSSAFLAASRELRSTLELIGRLTGELDERPTTVINLASSAEWVALRGTIFKKLEPYPEARAALSGALIE